MIDEGEETRGGGEVEWIVIDEERGIASSDHQIQLCHAINLSGSIGTTFSLSFSGRLFLRVDPLEGNCFHPLFDLIHFKIHL